MKRAFHILSWLTLFGWLSEAMAHAQTTGTCPRAEADAYLDVNNVRARILNNGGLFYRGQPHVYQVPKEDSTNAIFAFNLWVGGLVNGVLRIAATRYGEWEFWPGPLNDLGNPPADCAPYDRLWEITRDDLAAFNATGIPTDNLRDWPWQLGAPVINGDGNPDNYDLNGGDRPALLGDQMFWWVMNDRGNIHESTDAPPLGVEVRGSAFAFHRLGSFIDDVTFYRYVLHYKGRQPLEDAYVGFYADNDMGDAWDDYVASDTMLHLGYTYNADEDDEGTAGYGTPPPAVGYTILKGPLAQPDSRDNDRDGAIDEPGERYGMATFACFLKSGCNFCEPITGDEYYNCLQGRWRNSDPILVGGRGIGQIQVPGVPETPTPFLFPGDPVTGSFWTMENIDDQGTAADPFDTRFSMSSGPFTMQPGETEEFIVAVVWARGDDRLDSVRRLKAATANLRDAAAALLVPDATAGVPRPPLEPVFPLGFAQNYPNPFSQTTTIRYSLPQPMRVRLCVFDVLGRTVATLVNEQQERGLYEVLFEARSLPAGVYVYRIEMDHLRFTKPMMLIP